MSCEKIQVLDKEGICISEDLGYCIGCENEFFIDLKRDGFKGLKITEKGIEEF